MDCLVCQKSSDSYSILWNASSSADTMFDVIKHHLPWFQEMKIPSETTIICVDCWKHLDDFHQFYTTVKSSYEIFRCQNNEKKPITDALDEDDVDDIIEADDTVDEIEEVITTEIWDVETADELVYTENDADDVNYINEELDDTIVSEQTEEILEDGSECQVEEEEISAKKIPVPGKKRRGARYVSLDLENLIKNDKQSEAELIKTYIVMSCDLCAYIGQDFSDISQHLMFEHEVEQPYIKCCGRKLDKKYKLLEHAYRHHKPDYFKCKECNKFFADSNILKTHWLANHAPEEQLVFACDKCPKRFSRQHFLDLHKPSHIPFEEREFFCKLCSNNKPFASEHTLQIHINTRHKKATNVCHICAKVIRDKQAFEKHVRLHSGQSGPRVKCPRPDCDSWLKDKDNLKQHLRRHNDEGKEFLCNECGKICKNRRALGSHFTYAHGNNQLYSCEECKKSFKKAISLKEHMAQHTGEALYKCPFCPRKFNSNANMHSHKKRMHPVEWEHWRKTKTTSAQKIITSS